MDNTTATKLTLIAKLAKEDVKVRFRSLIHHLNPDYLEVCFKELKRRKAPGVDRRTIESYSDEEIRQVIQETVGAMKQKRYRPQPVRRVYIEKADGKKRPLGIPTVIDKVIQQGITNILTLLFEPLFLPVSYGFRPNLNAHDALGQVNHMIMGQKVNWIIDADIEGFFDHVDHTWMMKCLDQRIIDPNFKRLIMRFLKAGVMEEGMVQSTDKGTPQGGVLSPILANIYLHYVLDLWFETCEKKQMKGYVGLIRYADDFLIGVQHKWEAQQILNDLRERLKKFGLTLSEKKTKLIEFGRFAQENRERNTQGKPDTFDCETKRENNNVRSDIIVPSEAKQTRVHTPWLATGENASEASTSSAACRAVHTLDFLGFTHYATKTSDGRFMVRVKTSRKKMNKATKAMNQWLKSVRNLTTLPEIWKQIAPRLQGHYNYYGLSGNFDGLQRFYRNTCAMVFKWMNRRSQKKTWNWSEFYAYLGRYPLPKPKLTYAIYNTW